MIALQDVSEAIAEIEASRNQSPQACLRLASLYIIRDHLQDAQFCGQTAQNNAVSTVGRYNYSLAAPVAYNGEKSGFIAVPESLQEESEFLQAVEGRPEVDAWKIIDDLMDTLRVTSPRAYASVIRRLKDI